MTMALGNDRRYREGLVKLRKRRKGVEASQLEVFEIKVVQVMLVELEKFLHESIAQIDRRVSVLHHLLFQFNHAINARLRDG